ncbi:MULTISPECIES: hypothetical protein, partial [unclassified Pseudomonas]|uniref:hypothetical protein n=1 Tax=unclassified Pseudomonas TaxID=196821 RepID=UPI001C4392C9
EARAAQVNCSHRPSVARSEGCLVAAFSVGTVGIENIELRGVVFAETSFNTGIGYQSRHYLLDSTCTH